MGSVFLCFFVINSGLYAMSGSSSSQSPEAYCINLLLEDSAQDEQGRMILPRLFVDSICGYELQDDSKKKLIKLLMKLPIDSYNTIVSASVGSRGSSTMASGSIQTEALGFLVTELGRLAQGRDVQHQDNEIEAREIEILNDSITSLTDVAFALKELVESKQKRCDELEKQKTDVTQKLSRSRLITFITAGSAFIALGISNALTALLSPKAQV